LNINIGTKIPPFVLFLPFIPSRGNLASLSVCERKKSPHLSIYVLNVIVFVGIYIYYNYLTDSIVYNTIQKT
jgi:hypothetical protein